MRHARRKPVVKLLQISRPVQPGPITAPLAPPNGHSTDHPDDALGGGPVSNRTARRSV
ncbi:hypothetical protein RR11_759 [Ruegeria sp. R11]|nr:hypothetical protein RR11_759 [Ruegeria sp. R11]